MSKQERGCLFANYKLSLPTHAWSCSNRIYRRLSDSFQLLLLLQIKTRFILGKISYVGVLALSGLWSCLTSALLHPFDGEPNTLLSTGAHAHGWCSDQVLTQSYPLARRPRKQCLVTRVNELTKSQGLSSIEPRSDDRLVRVVCLWLIVN